ncbi:MAG TPA: NAD-dependent succinate-semialdehyde dehydrogenase, partial [Micropruina sp.]|nr:NAD-dependent succinate-semialdehyde dehydrogenase [Micropruina sp.]
MSSNREAELLAGVPDGLFIGGEWRAASGGGTLAVRDPSDGSVIRQIADGTVDDGLAALDAAV